MPSRFLRERDWQRDTPDHRDLAPGSNPVQRLLRRLRPARPDQRPPSVDWREFFPPAQDQGELPTSVAHACISLTQYFERRSSGRLIEPSRAFVDKNARRLGGGDGAIGVSIRETLKAIVRFGLPPERLWPYTAAGRAAEPPAFAYSFTRGIEKARYCRLDSPQQSREAALEAIRGFVAAGFCCVLGFPLVQAIDDSGDIFFPSLADSISGGSSAVVVGYDDERRIRSDKGALLIRCSWGHSWGQQGYGWLPFSYALRGLAVDVWTLLSRRWLRSGEFFFPGGVRVA